MGRWLTEASMVEAADRGARLRAAFARWRERPPWAHLGAVGLLALLMLVRWWPVLSPPAPHLDERTYLAAFARVAAGESPYLDAAYAYPPAFAFAGARAVAALGQEPVLYLLRALNLLGLAVALWCAMAWLPWRWRTRMGAGALFLMAAPAVRFGVLWGNLSLALAGVLVVALLLWPRSPVGSGVLLGLSVAVKPLVPGAVLALLVHRPTPAGGRSPGSARGLSASRSAKVAAAVAMALAAALVLGFPYLADLRALAAGDLVSRSVAPHRLVYLLGVRVHAGWISAAIAAVVVILARRLILDRMQLVCFALAAALATSPLVWHHTLLLALPIQVLALQVAIDRRRGAPAEARRRRAWEVVFVGLGAAAISLAEGATGIYDSGRMIQFLGTLPPALAPALLAGYVIRHTGALSEPAAGGS